MAEGDIGAVIDSLEFDVSYGQHTDIIHVSGDVFAIAYASSSTTGTVATVTVNNAGDIGAAVVDTLVFDTSAGNFPKLIHVSGNVYAISYQGYFSRGWLATVAIETDGQIGAAVVDDQQITPAAGETPDIIHISGNVFAFVCKGTDGDGWLYTVTISDAGDIGAAVIDSLEFDTVNGEQPNIVHVSGNVFAIAYKGADDDGWLKTVTISDAGAIGAAVIDSLEFDTADCYYPKVIHISGNVFATCYGNAWATIATKTVTIESDGQIGAAVIDSLQLSADGGGQPSIIHVSGDVFAITDQGTNSDGWLYTVTIETDGQIGAAVIDSLEFDTADCYYPKVIHISGDVFAIAYTGTGENGWLKTVDIETVPVGTPQHLMTMGVG